MTPPEALALAEEMLALAAAATPGPWEVKRGDDPSCSAVYRMESTNGTEVACANCNAEPGYCVEPSDSDSDFICRTRTLGPLLAQAVKDDRCRETFRRLEDIVGECGAHGTQCQPALVDRTRNLADVPDAALKAAEARGYERGLVEAHKGKWGTP